MSGTDFYAIFLVVVENEGFGSVFKDRRTPPIPSENRAF